MNTGIFLIGTLLFDLLRFPGFSAEDLQTRRNGLEFVTAAYPLPAGTCPVS